MKPTILLAMSTFPRNLFVSRYSVQNEAVIIEDCISQLEPVVRYFLRMHGGNDVNIVILETEPTKEKKCIQELIKEDGPLKARREEFSKEPQSAVDFFKERIDKCPEKKGRQISYCDIDLDEDNPENAIKEAVEKIRTFADGKAVKEGQFWIDTHGGLRDCSLITNAIVSLLRLDPLVRLQGVKVFGVKTSTNVIVDQRKAFGIFDFVCGMKDFVNFGNADVLCEYYGSGSGRNRDVKRVTDAMRKISLGTQFCNELDYEEGLDDLGTVIANIQQNGAGEESFLSIFAELIKQDYGNLLDAEKRTTLDLIERCRKKGLYQQALTFLEALMPGYLYRTGVFSFAPEDTAKVTEARENSDVSYKTNENYVFDEMIRNAWTIKRNACDFIAKDNKEKMQGQMIEYYALGKIGTNPVQSRHLYHFQFPTEIYLRNGETLRITSMLDESQKTIAGRVMQMHKALKDCRNMLNHAKAEYRPKIEWISKTIEKYIQEVKKIDLQAF